MIETTPLVEQYRKIKRDYQDMVLFFRLGDFYEMFAEDALEVSSLLNLTLTSRNGLPMCGVPYHAARSYIARLLNLGKKVAICEQVTEPGKGKGLIERQVVEVVTPGTAVDEDFLERGTANYLASLVYKNGFFSFSYIELSTGEFWTTHFQENPDTLDHEERIRRELGRLAPRELIIQESLLEEQGSIQAILHEYGDLVINRWPDWVFDSYQCYERLLKQFKAVNLKAFGLEEGSPEILSAGAILLYLDETARSVLPHVRSLHVYGEEDFVAIDEASQKNLELVQNQREGDSRYTLFEVLDHTKTSMGKRLLRWRILHPLREKSAIHLRLRMVELFYHDQGRLSQIRELLSRIPDLERLSARLAMDKAHGKDLVAIRTALAQFHRLQKLIDECGLPSEYELKLGSQEQSQLVALQHLLEQAICDEPSVLLTEGNLIREGYSKELDHLKELQQKGRSLLEEYLEEERKKTGITNLKMKYNRLIGYYFEVSRANLTLVPPYFIRRQGIAGGERFTTERLMALESEIEGAAERSIELEKNLFLEIREKAKESIPLLLDGARRIAEIDVTASLAWAATLYGWNAPEIDESCRLCIKEGRHPVVEAHLPRGEFIPNDTDLDGEGFFFALITGPNMAGKSTYLRQSALITIMAQMGSFVPAREARIGVVDKIFCRVGASDNLARGESTFLVEMNETARILRSATKRSLVIMDEVGRGTGTKDGLAIAWAVCEELLEHIRCRTLFATHYHELSRLEHPGMMNRSMGVEERDGTIVFLRKLKEGATTESYGIHVAQLAGIPPNVLERAMEIMKALSEQEELLQHHIDTFQGAPQGEAEKREVAPLTPSEKKEKPHPILEELLRLDPNRLTPLEALGRIYAWKEFLLKQSQKAPHRSYPKEKDLFE
ncbi:DNA mismatch repair protein MutS [Treponema sp. J25]|uniref:DNA mismatch repair protein MutS n=1 Tax=Treponema sp. J25 TaxID=2094121 RepID=UPI00104D55B6|nr:DNA mismatch repair protein MutS [Treponema sp. J25]TCW61382.1 DNA mismatch repair protein MutS [Treponema sp. J25]